MEKIKWTDMRTNEEVLSMVKEQRTLLKTVQKRKGNWIRLDWRGQRKGK
jgi:hypothetical protein